MGEIDHIEEMDVSLSVRELREILSAAGELHAAKLLSGQYVVEPWIRVRAEDGRWIVAFGIEVTPDGDDGA